MSLTPKSENDLLEDEILKACEAGNLSVVKKLIQKIKFNPDLNKIDDTAYEIFMRACMHGHLKIVKEFINNPHTSQHINRPYIINEALLESSYVSNVNIVSYLINEPQVIRSDKFYSKCYLAGLDTAKNGHIDTLKALLNLSEDNSNRSILENGQILEYACNHKQYDFIKYIYTEPKLEGFFNKDNCFKYVCIKKDLDLLRFFVWDLNIEKTRVISDFLNKNEYNEIENLFELRKLNQHLNIDLDSNKNTTKKLKL